MGGGGAERQLAHLAAPLIAHGWSFVAGLAQGGANLATLIEGGAQIEWLTGRGHHDPRLAHSIRRIILKERPDLVHSWLPQMDVIAGLAALPSKVPWVMSERTSIDAFQVTWKQRLRMALAKRATAIVANSHGGARIWHERAPGVPVYVIPNGVDLEAIDRARAGTREEMGVPAGARIVLAAGRCVPEKNQRLLIEALAMLDRDIVLIICGDGPLREAMQLLARNLGVTDRVRFPGYVEMLWAWMKRAHAFASVGWYEGHPNVVLEAMAAHCPVVVSDIEAHRDVVSREEAVFVDPGSAIDLARGIMEVLHRDSTSIVAAARDRVEGFSMWATAKAYDTLYREIVAGSGG